MKKFLDLTNHEYGNYKVLARYGKDSCGRAIWKCECQCQFKTIKYIRTSSLRSGLARRCKRCGQNTLYCGEMSGSFWAVLRSEARKRNIEFLITREFAWELFLKQNRKCALSGQELYFESLSGKRDGIASLDRIDSKKHYTEDNIQWIHKKLNIMKRELDNQEFINMCKMVAEYNK